MDSKEKFKFASINCWTDGSGFEFDGEPTNLIGPTSLTEKFFSLTGRMAKNSIKGWSLWSNWIDKFQIDNRFLLLSDENAEAILHPNVDDPWMFTEYVFKGIGKKYNPKNKKMEEVSCLVVEPPLYDEETLLLKNYDRQFSASQDLENFDEFDIEVECANYNQNRIEGKVGSEKYIFVKSCRTISEDGWGYGYPVNDPGVRLYRVPVNVESVKWGEHGNIPPHTLNMYAPPSWMDTKTKKNIELVTTAKIGYPIYANSDGIFFHASNNFDYVVPIVEKTWTNFKNEEEAKKIVEKEGAFAKFYYNIPKEKDLKNEYIQTKGRGLGNAEKNSMAIEYIQQSQNGDIVTAQAKGCSLFNRKGGVCYCTAADKNNPNFTNTLKVDLNKCLFGKKEDSECPQFILNEPTAISTYETVALDKDQYYSATYGMTSTDNRTASNFETAYSVMGGLGAGMGAMLGASVLNSMQLNYKPGIKDYQESNVYFETSFKITDAPAEDYQVTEGKTSGGKKTSEGVRVIRGSGNQIIDNFVPWQGGDNYAVGDIDQVNFPYFTQSVMPCYNPAYCNEMCGLAMQGGYDASSRANSQSQNDNDTKSEFIDYCRYYKSKENGVECPFDNVPKTAYEFQEAQRIGKPALEQTIMLWISSLNGEIEESGIVEDWQNIFVKETGFANGFPLYTLYSKNNETSTFGGLECGKQEKVIINEKETMAYKICKFTLTSVKPRLASIQDLYFWWTPLDNDGQKIIENGEEVIWFCKFEKTLPVSKHFTHYVDNWYKFIGGSHPLYKDYSKRGGEHMQEKKEISEYERDLGDGEVGGDPEYSGAEEPKSKVGYWIDEDGEWILDELEFEEHLKYDKEGRARKRTTKELTNMKFNGDVETKIFTLTDKEWEYYDKGNERENPSGVTLSFEKSNTIINSDGTSKSPQTKNCAVLLNDTKSLIEAFMFSPPMRVDDDGNKVAMPPYVSDYTALPSERSGAYCEICGYFLNEKYGASHGSEDKGITCPWCKTELVLKPITKLHKQKAIGQVDFWALPGTVIDSKSYFWKAPTFINNAMIDQIEYKAMGNASLFNSKSEITNGYQKEFKGYYKPIPDIFEAGPNGEFGKKRQEYIDEIDKKIKELENRKKELEEKIKSDGE